MKAKYTNHINGNISVEYDDYITDERVTREFTCPRDGGYVREWDERTGEWKQVCDGLSHRGPALQCSKRERLGDLIRREFRIMRNNEKSYK